MRSRPSALDMLIIFPMKVVYSTEFCEHVRKAGNLRRINVMPSSSKKLLVWTRVRES